MHIFLWWRSSLSYFFICWIDCFFSPFSLLTHTLLSGVDCYGKVWWCISPVSFAMIYVYPLFYCRRCNFSIFIYQYSIESTVLNSLNDILTLSIQLQTWCRFREDLVTVEEAISWIQSRLNWSGQTSFLIHHSQSRRRSKSWGQQNIPAALTCRRCYNMKQILLWKWRLLTAHKKEIYLAGSRELC